MSQPHKKTLEEMVAELPPEAKQEIQHFVEFVSQKYPRPQMRRKPNFKWAGCLKELKDQYTSVELQHEIAKWRAEKAEK